MYSRWFSEPDPAYGQLVTRLYGESTGEALDCIYRQQLSRDSGTGQAGAPLWSRRLDWSGVVLSRGEEVVAHAVVQVARDKPLVYVGYVEAVEEQGAAADLVQAVRDRLRAEHPHLTLYLPVNLSIWHNYRFKAWGDEPLPFEPPSLPYYARLFDDLFPQKESYSSYRMPLPAAARERTDGRLRIRQIRLSDLHAELRVLYELSSAIFESEHSNPGFEEFAAIYGNSRLPGVDGIDPRLVLIAEWEGRPVGFIFAVARHQTAYIKTFGVLPQFRRWRVARQLYDTLCSEARKLGCDTLYGLMIRDDRPVRRLLPAGTVRVAGYTLFKGDAP